MLRLTDVLVVLDKVDAKYDCELSMYNSPVFQGKNTLSKVKARGQLAVIVELLLQSKLSSCELLL